ncbi:hypothetical protein AVEN_247815-1 [Araneus ventricosus]|uniref:Uncharacterized protein n=2 Tax=Araneus ventricosus TaxID=182803 RepID=A0A4Y2P8E7_ARAVE|nr:hypothetical protein AVEN_247815-1 [Araneus ventricosus]
MGSSSYTEIRYTKNLTPDLHVRSLLPRIIMRNPHLQFPSMGSSYTEIRYTKNLTPDLHVRSLLPRIIMINPCPVTSSLGTPGNILEFPCTLPKRFNPVNSRPGLIFKGDRIWKIDLHVRSLLPRIILSNLRPVTSSLGTSGNILEFLCTLPKHFNLLNRRPGLIFKGDRFWKIIHILFQSV